MKVQVGQRVYAIRLDLGYISQRSSALVFFWAFNEHWICYNNLTEYFPVRLEVWQSKLLEVLCES